MNYQILEAVSQLVRIHGAEAVGYDMLIAAADLADSLKKELQAEKERRDKE